MLRFLLQPAAVARVRISSNSLLANRCIINGAARGMANKRIITAASLRNASLRSEQGVAPIDTDGDISLIDDSSELEVAAPTGGKIKEITELLPKARKPKPSQRSEAEKAEAAAQAAAAATTTSRADPNSWDDLSKPPKAPASSTHSSAALPDTAWDALQQTKGTWQSSSRKLTPRERASMRRSGSQEEGAENQPRSWDNIKGAAMPTIGWADARARAPQQSAADSASAAAAGGATTAAGTPSAVWSDAEFVALFPHLRSEAESSAAGVAGADAAQLLHLRIEDLRRKYPELPRLHFASTLIKVRKWRELLGATRMEMPLETQGVTAATSTEAESEAAAADDSSTHPKNALHHRYFQPDIFLTSEQVSQILMRQRDLLYANIEKVIAPRLAVLRAHLPGVNMGAVLLRNPALLLTDLSASLPLKLRELKSLFPEVNLVTLVEKDSSILSRSASAHLVPRLNLFASVTGYAPRHVVQFLAVEHPTVLAARWNKLKRIEIVRDERFWTWWEQQPMAAETRAAEEEKARAAEALAALSTTTTATTTDAPAATADADASTTTTPSSTDSSASDSSAAAAAVAAPVAAPVASAPAVTAVKNRRDPASLPFALYHDLLSQTQESFDALFPWWTLSYSALEKELFGAQTEAARDTLARKRADDVGATLAAAAPGTSGRHALANVSATLLASVPGNPQPLSLALGLTPDSTLSRDALKAKQRMDYLALKNAKREAREQARDSMRQREREHQQRKMQDYTAKFNSFRNRTMVQPASSSSTSAAEETSSSSASSNYSRGNTADAFNSLASSFNNSSSSSSSAPAPSSSFSASSSSGGGGGRRQTNTGFDESSYPDLKRGGSSSYSSSSFTQRTGGRDDRSSRGGGFGGSDRGSSRYGSGSRDDGEGSFNDGSAVRDRPRGDRGDRGGFQSQHQKNRPGDALSRRHQAHAPGRVERFGGRPVAFTNAGQELMSARSIAAAAPVATPAAAGERPASAAGGARAKFNERRSAASPAASTDTPRWRI